MFDGLCKNAYSGKQNSEASVSEDEFSAADTKATFFTNCGGRLARRLPGITHGEDVRDGCRCRAAFAANYRFKPIALKTSVVVIPVYEYSSFESSKGSSHLPDSLIS